MIRGILAFALVACADAHAPSREALQRELSRSSQGLHVESLSHGVRKIDLHGRFQHVVVVRRGQRACLDRPE